MFLFDKISTRLLAILFLSGSLGVEAAVLLSFGLAPSGPPLYYSDGATFREIPVSEGRFSAPLQLKQTDKLTLFRRVDTESGTQYLPVFEAPLLQSESWIILVKPIVGGTNWDIHLLPFDGKARSAYQILVYNDTSQRIVGVFDEERFTLQPGQSDTIMVPTNGEAGTVGLAFHDDGTWKPFYTTRWTGTPDRLRLVVISDPGEPRDQFNPPPPKLRYNDLNLRVLRRDLQRL